MKRSSCIIACACLLAASVATVATAGGKVTIVDGVGRSVTVTAPVTRIVSVTAGASELICAFGAADRIVGRDSYSIFPSSLLGIPQVAGSSYDPNLELVLKQRPEVVIGDTMLKEPMISKLEAQGIAVVVDSPGDSTRLFTIIRNLGLIMDETEEAEKIVGYLDGIQDMVAKRLAGVKPEDKPSVFYEWYRPYYSASASSVYQGMLDASGGMNIAAEESTSYPQLSAEWVMQRNPRIILRMSSTNGLSAATAAKERDEVLNRPELKRVKAVRDGKVYIVNYHITHGMRYPVCLLYLSKWFHPELFTDVDPETVHRQIVERFFGKGEWPKVTIVSAYPAQ